MKKLSILFIMVMFSFMAKAQITLDSANFPTSANETDTLYNLVELIMLKSPMPGTNMNWDYYSKNPLIGGGQVTISGYSAPPASGIFKTATRTSASGFLLGSGSVDSVKNTLYFTDNASGYACIGYSITQRQSFGHTEYNGNDSLIYLKFDTSIAANPQYILKYPAAYDSVWTYSARLTYPLQMYINPPPSNYYFSGREIIHRTVIDSVVGWGNMVVPYDSAIGFTFASRKYPVIMVKEISVDMDSFTLSGLPGYSEADIGNLFQNFGSNNVQKFETYTYIFYRAGYSEPLAKFWGIDPHFKYLSGASFGISNTTRTGIKNISAPAMGVSVYPSPATSTLTITSATTPILSITVYDATGRVVYTNFSKVLNFGKVIDVAALPSGMYIVKLGFSDGNYEAKFMKE